MCPAPSRWPWMCSRSGMRDPMELSAWIQKGQGAFDPCHKSSFLVGWGCLTGQMTVPIHLPQLINLFNPTPRRFAALWFPGREMLLRALSLCKGKTPPAPAGPLCPSCHPFSPPPWPQTRTKASWAAVTPSFPPSSPLLPARCLLSPCRALRETLSALF